MKVNARGKGCRLSSAREKRPPRRTDFTEASGGGLESLGIAICCSLDGLEVQGSSRRQWRWQDEEHFIAELKEGRSEGSPKPSGEFVTNSRLFTTQRLGYSTLG